MATKVLSIFGVIVLISLLIGSTQQSFGIEESGMKWQLVYLSDQPGCGKYHHDKKNLYEQLAEQYMTEVYKFKNSKHLADCFPERNFKEKYHQPEDLDLLIIVYEKDLGERELHSKQIGGLYYHGGDFWEKNHTIILCDCSSFDYSEPTWILTHELSHFMLYYLGYPESIAEKKIHGFDKKYDDCIEGIYTNDCNDVKKKLRLDSSAYSYNVMSPYQPAIESKSLRGFGNLTFEELFGKNNGLQVITKWWIEGKISDKDIKYALDNLINNSVIPAKELDLLKEDKEPLKIFTEPPRGNDELVFDYSHYENNSIKKIESVLSNIPHFKELSMDESTKPNNSNTIIKEETKEKVKSWLSGNISDDEVMYGFKQIIAQDKPWGKTNGLISLEGEKNSIYNPHRAESSITTHGGDEIKLVKQDKITVAGMVIPEFGTTNIGIKDESIKPSSIIKYEIQSINEKKSQHCEGITVNDGKFFLHCKNNVDNAIIYYSVYN